MKFSLKAMTMGVALLVGASGAVTAAPAEARTQVYLGIGSGYGPGYYDAGYRDGYRGYGDGYRDRDWRGGYRGRDWDRRGWRGGNRWRGGYRDRCWTEWRWSRYNGRVPVRICR